MASFGLIYSKNNSCMFHLVGVSEDIQTKPPSPPRLSNKKTKKKKKLNGSSPK